MQNLLYLQACYLYFEASLYFFKFFVESSLFIYIFYQKMVIHQNFLFSRYIVLVTYVSGFQTFWFAAPLGD
jgi:hypothetical protein